MENSVYTVTPPSLHLNENGPSIMLIGYNDDEMEIISKMFEQIFDISITIFYLNDTLNTGNIPWARAVASIAEYIVVNPCNVSAAETYMAFAITKERPSTLYWVAPSNEITLMTQMINSFVSEHTLLPSFEDFALLLGVPESVSESS